MVRTSFVYHQVAAVLSLVGTVAFVIYIIKGRLIQTGNWGALSMGILLLSAVWGIHGLLHFAEEYVYNYDPLQKRTAMLTEPIRGCPCDKQA